MKKVRAATLLIWGEDDVALGVELTHGMEACSSVNRAWNICPTRVTS
jgi:hypothetical protein